MHGIPESGITLIIIFLKSKFSRAAALDKDWLLIGQMKKGVATYYEKSNCNEGQAYIKWSHCIV